MTEHAPGRVPARIYLALICLFLVIAITWAIGFWFDRYGIARWYDSFMVAISVMTEIGAGLVVIAMLIRREIQARAAADQRAAMANAAYRQEAEERRRLFETSLDLILITDRRGNFTRVSSSSLAILGYRPEELIGHSAISFIYPEDLEPTRGEMRLARRGRQIRNFESRYIHKDGHIVSLA